MSWRIEITATANKQLKRLPANISRKIGFVIDTLVDDPFAGDVVKLGGYEDIWRRRVGSYRIKFEFRSSSKTIYIIDIERRTSKTY